jgi:HEAT repeat protein
MTQPPRSIESLLQAVGDPTTWTGASSELSARGDKRTVEPMIALLRAPSWAVRMKAAEALGFLGDRRAVEPLLQMLRDVTEGHAYAVRARAARGGSASAETIAGPEDKVYYQMNNVCQVIEEALTRLRDRRAVAPLVEMLSDPIREIRWCAVSVLGHLGDPRAVEPLMARIEDSDPYVRDWAIWALGQLGDQRVAEPLLARLEREYHQAVAVALGLLREPCAVEPLMAYLATAIREHPARSAVRSPPHHSAAWALGEIGDRRAVPVLVDMLDHDESENRLATFDTARAVAARALGQLRDPRAFEALVRALQDDDEYNRDAAAVALGHLGDPRGVDVLLGVLQGEDAGVRGSVCEGLGLLGDTRAVEPLLRALGDASDIVRSHAAEALGRLADRRAVDPLVETLRDGDSFVRESAAEALGVLGDPRAVQPLIEALRDDVFWAAEAAAVALGRLGDAGAIEPLMTRLTSLGTDRRVRLAAIRALDGIGDGRARPALEWAREHDIAPNADAAGEALERLAHR